MDSAEAALLLAMNQGAQVFIGYEMNGKRTENYCVLKTSSGEENDLPRETLKPLADKGYIESGGFTHMRGEGFAMKSTEIVVSDKGKEALRLHVAPSQTAGGR